MKDYRQPEHRREYFTKLYHLNLTHGIMPGLVYLYMPALAKRYGWDIEQRLWFAFLNGLTQNPITSMLLFLKLDHVPTYRLDIKRFNEWFNDNWEHLQFDTDRKYQKKDTAEAIESYSRSVNDFGSQQAMLADKTYEQLWRTATSFPTFGRLSAFSYLEYVLISGAGADCTDLMFRDKTGSKSHRNGMFFLLGLDHRVCDKRQPNSYNGSYLESLLDELEITAEVFLDEFRKTHPGTPNVSKFTMESNLCTFKNHFYGHRYPGVYADMAWQRIEHADAHGHKDVADIFRAIRAEHLPRWLRMECEQEPRPSIKQRAMVFPSNGRPFRWEYFKDSKTPTA